MDFVERFLGVSPDAGSGAFELALILAPILVIAWIVARRHCSGKPGGFLWWN